MTKRGEPKFFQTEAFKKLYETWITGKRAKIIEKGKEKTKILPSKLSRAGFEDIENPNGSLKVKNKRTQGYLQQEDLQRISSALMGYVSRPAGSLEVYEKKILELHSQGVYRKDIMRITKKSHSTVWKVIKKHLPLALGLYAKDEMLKDVEIIGPEGNRNESLSET